MYKPSHGPLPVHLVSLCLLLLDDALSSGSHLAQVFPHPSQSITRRADFQYSCQASQEEIPIFGLHEFTDSILEHKDLWHKVPDLCRPQLQGMGMWHCGGGVCQMGGPVLY